ncbi:hypothetical protein POM88_036252 [Heracleum sosnowskyi]|uniref:Transposase MuDR plant domain-containing protein n=1 Tax=Heracleum sosnowskyi TaxID=360622 RepID=A0AAD8HMU5_9APIA|nr:hypothetical protein POM88_036252 [Heracleum sosnowskyi]
MNSIRVEIQHGGEFNTKEGIYYYKGGTIDNIYNVDISALSIDRCLNFLRDIGYGNGLKLYYKKPLTTGIESYILLWNDESVEQLRKDVMPLSSVCLFVDHCAEEKVDDVVEEMNFESDVSDYEEEQYSDSEESCDEDSIGDDVESDSDEELEAIRERKRMLKEGMIDPLREGNLTDMNIGNGVFDRDEERQHEPTSESRTKNRHDPALCDKPVWQDFVQHEFEMLNSSFPKYAENQHLGCDTVEKNAEEKDSSDSFDAASLESSDSSDHEEFDLNKLRRGKNRKKQKPIFPTFNPNTPMELIDFQPGLIFTSRQLLRDAIRNYGVAKQRRVFIKRSDFKRLQAKCRDNCKWELWASRLQNDEAYQVKTYQREHNCIIVSKQRMVKADWLAKEFGNIIRSNPRWKLKEFAAAINAKFKMQYYGTGAEVLRTNPGSSVFIKGEATVESENPTFQRPTKGLEECN